MVDHVESMDLPNGVKIEGLGRINVLLGRNGCGKSTLLKSIYRYCTANQSVWASARYITPERGGMLMYDPGIEQNLANNSQWLGSTRVTNQYAQFREQTISQYRQLEINVLREYVRRTESGEGASASFDEYLQRINSLLDNIELRPQGTSFKIFSKQSENEVDPREISSGESELITLAIESLVCASGLESGQKGLLLLDEPDVHLHPDLQVRLVQFLTQLVNEVGLDIIIATHSTPILGELANMAEAAVCPMSSGQKSFHFESVDEVYKQLLPVFGAHPLTRVFSDVPILLVEGEDDVRIWQQAI